MDWEPGDRVWLAKTLPGHSDNVGTVARIGSDGRIWVKWEGPGAPPVPGPFAAGAIEAPDGMREFTAELGTE
jgi:hypothetical protein